MLRCTVNPYVFLILWIMHFHRNINIQELNLEQYVSKLLSCFTRYLSDNICYYKEQ